MQIYESTFVYANVYSIKLAYIKKFSEDLGVRCKYISIYSLHLALIAEYLLSMICVFQKKDLSLNPKVRQTNRGQSWTSPTSENRYCFVTYLKF